MTDPTPRRQRRRVLTDKMVASLPRRPARYFHPDPEMPGHGVRVYPEGPSVYYVIARDAFRKQRWVRIAATAELTIADSREQARAVIRRLKQGLEPFEPPAPKADSVADVVATWLRRHVEAKGLRTGGELRRIAERHLLPVWKDQPFAEIRRSDIARLLDAIEDEHGVWVADSVLHLLSSIATWYAQRSDNYVPPFVRGMRRVPAQQRKRSRIFDDDELRAVWRTAEADKGPFGPFVQVLLLSAQRRDKVKCMRWDDVAPDGTWSIPTAPREKGNPGTLQLPPLAMAIINAQPRLLGCPFVFAGRDNGPIRGFSDRHAAFKARCGVEGWSLHDLRRCARSWMSRAGVARDVAEAVLGHKLPGVEGVYDVYERVPEMADALQRLARLVEEIVYPPTDTNVVPMRQPAAQP